MNKIVGKLKKWFEWYVKGYYHCDKCPFSWEERNYDGDADAGCYIRGDLWDTCRLLPPFRFLIGWPRRRVTRYWEVHAYDDIGEWYEQEVGREEAMTKVVMDLLDGREVCSRDENGELDPLPAPYEMFLDFLKATRDYEDKCHPPKSLRQEWEDLLVKTWKRFSNKFRPYL